MKKLIILISIFFVYNCFAQNSESQINSAEELEKKIKEIENTGLIFVSVLPVVGDCEYISIGEKISKQNTEILFVKKRNELFVELLTEIFETLDSTLWDSLAKNFAWNRYFSLIRTGNYFGYFQTEENKKDSSCTFYYIMCDDPGNIINEIESTIKKAENSNEKAFYNILTSVAVKVHSVTILEEKNNIDDKYVNYVRFDLKFELKNIETLERWPDLESDYFYTLVRIKKSDVISYIKE